VVSSLFPENVKEQLINDGVEEAKQDKTVSWRISESRKDQNSVVAMINETRPRLHAQGQ
jgi:hypothetical protein